MESNNPKDLNKKLLTSSKGTNIWKKIGYIALIVGILGGFADFMNFINVIPGFGEKAMQLTVYVQDIKGKPITELENKGKIIVDFGNDRRAYLIGENGRTNFGEIPKNFYNKEIPVVIVAEGYEPIIKNITYLMSNKPIYINVQRDNSMGSIYGIVKNRAGTHFISNALIMVDQDTTVITDSLGRFNLIMPIAKQKSTYKLTIKKDGYEMRSEYYKPKSGQIEIRLNK